MLVALDLADADIRLDPAWMPVAEADALLLALRGGIAWETHRIRMFGRELDSPRLSCWIGDPGASYTYSRSRFEPRPWPALLAPWRERVSATAGAAFNSVLANLYRDGADSMGWHRDDEPELGPRPVIASLSLGAPRRFLLRRSDGAGATRELLLGHGSMLVMAGSTQSHWRHALPRTARPVGERINLTFRHVQPGH